MAKGVNKVILIGRLGGDPVVKRKDNFIATNISVATSEAWTDKNTGEKRQSTEWHRVVFYNKLAEIVEKYLKKGDPIYIEGKNKTRKYSDKDGIERQITEVIAHEMQMLGGGVKKEERNDNEHYEPEENPYKSTKNSDSGNQSQAQFDDDIPF